MKFSLLRLSASIFAVLLSVVPGFAQGTALTEPLAALAKPTEGLVGLTAEGALLRSTNNGVSFQQTRAADSPSAFYAVAASGATVVAMGDAANFVRSTTNGSTWSALVSALNPAHDGPINALAANGSTWVAVGQSGARISVLRSTNSGASWTTATTPSTPSDVGSLRGVTWTGTRWVAVGGDEFFGFIYTSTDGASWSRLTATDHSLRAVASDGAGRVLAVGNAGLMLYAIDHAASPSTFASVGENIVSEDLYSVIFTAGNNWIIGGDNGAVLTFSGSAPGTVVAPGPSSSAPVTALVPTGVGAGFLYYSEASSPPAPHGPISLQISLVSGQLQLTLVGAETGNSYLIESSTTLASFTFVANSTRVYSGGSAPSWTFPAPGPGNRIFYRAKVATGP